MSYDDQTDDLQSFSALIDGQENNNKLKQSLNI